MSLTQGALLTICQGGTVECPNLQLLSFKRIAGSSSERYRLLVSDGMYSNSYAMLATQLNNVITDNLVDNNCIIRVNKMQCNIMQGKKVIIILDLDVLRSGTQVGQKLGTPIAINADGTVSENDRQAVAATGQKAGKRTGEEADNQPIAKKPLQQQSHNRPSMLSATSGTDPSHLSIYPIASLTPYQNKWTIKARVTNKTDIRRWSNSRGEGHLFSMDLVDESGEIRATAFKEQCDKYYNMVEIGKVFYFTSGTLKSANRQYSTLNNEYEMTFRDTTEVIPCTTEEETASIPTLTFNFCQIGQLDASLKDSNVDIIAVVKAAGDVVTITSSRTQKELRKRDITLVDKSLVEVGLTLWGGTADNFDATGNPVVAIKGAKVSDYNGVSLSCSFSSVLQINPDLPQCHELKGWYEAEGSKATTSSITTASGGGAGGNFGANVKTFGEVKKENLGMGDKPEYYSATAFITMIQKDKALYQACGNVNGDKSCNKKVQDQNNGTYRCEKCNTETESFNWRLILSIAMADATDNQWVNCFQEQGEAILGEKADELGAMQERDKDTYDKIFAQAAFKRYNLRLRCKADTYNDEQRVRHTIVSATPINFMEYNKKMIQELESAGIPLPTGINRDKYMN